MLFTFPSRYYFTIGRQVIFSLTRRSSQIPAGFPRSRSTRVSLHVAPHVPSTGLSPYIVSLSRPLRLHEPSQHPCRWRDTTNDPTTPTRQRHQALTPFRFGLVPFRSPLLRESRLFSFPRGTEMFQFPRFPLPVLCVHTGVTPAKAPGFPIRKSTVHNAF